jgi:ribosomal protein S12 methylthiotransferase accessory factor
MEAAELVAAERAVTEAWDSAAALAARHGPGAVISPAAFEPDAGEDLNRLRIAWRIGEDLANGAPVLVPAQAVHVPPAGGPWLGPAVVRWTSNGMGAAPRREAAVLHALLEAVERDRVARALPEGFTEGEVGRRLLDRASLAAAAPRAAALARRIEERGFRVFFLDLSEPSEKPSTSTTRSRTPSPVLPRDRDRNRDRLLLGLPTAAALILDIPGGPVPLAAGYACRLSRDAALRAALLEAAQSRATEIHGAREDVLSSDRHAAAALRGRLEGARPRRDPRRMPDLAVRSESAALRLVAGRLRRAGLRACAVDLGGAADLAVAKVIVPGLLLSELL